MIYNERTCIEPLSRGETVEVRGVGNSMTPLLVSGEVVTVDPIATDTVLSKGDVVIAKVRGRIYMHLIGGIRGDSYQIRNNHGHVNGWVSRKQIYGKARL